MSKWIELNNELVMKDENGSFQFNKDKEAVHSYFVDYVNQNTVFFHDLREKLDYLVENDYYDEEVLKLYSFKEIKSLYKLVYAKKFRFPSFMSAFKFYNNYALKTNDGKKFLERYEDRIVANALYLGDGNYEKAKRLALNLIMQNYQPATPTFLNTLRKRSGEMVSCFLLSVEDSTKGINYANAASSELSRIGGGVALNLSKLRASGDPIKEVENASSGVVGVAKILEDIFSHFNQLGQRDGSGVVYLNIFHNDIDALLDTKKINADEKSRLKTLSLGVIVPSKFFELAEKGLPYFTFSPYDVEKIYGQKLAKMNMDKWYEILVNNPKIRKEKKDPRLMLVKIAQVQQESGYPYFMYVDNANKVHPLKDIGDIEMSNLCNEIYQLQEDSDITGYNGDNHFGKDVSCNLGSLNIVSVMENKMLEEAVKTGIDALYTVADKTDIKQVPTISNANKSLKSIGLGAMNLHGYYAKNKIMYESEEAKEFANVFFAAFRFYSIQRCMEISKETGFVFEGFERSEYAKGIEGIVFNKYVDYDYLPVSKKVINLFDGIYIPTKEDWLNLSKDVQKHGICSAYQNAIAPTQSISYVQSATSSVMPITNQIETRTYGDSTTHYPMPFISNENFFYYKSAYDMDMFKVIDLIATIQEHIDQGISTTLFVKSDATTREMARYYIYAHKKGLKGLYYTRTKLLSIDECLSCSV